MGCQPKPRSESILSKTSSDAASASGSKEDPAVDLSSPAFADGQPIPRTYTCKGDDVSPPLSWSGVPDGTASLTLIVDDPDAPQGTWDHWVLFDLPADERALPRGAGADPPTPARTGRNSWDRTDYGGPCPPSGEHRYIFELYALDTKLDLDAPTKHQLEAAMRGHVLAKGRLVGTYDESGG